MLDLTRYFFVSIVAITTLSSQAGDMQYDEEASAASDTCRSNMLSLVRQSTGIVLNKLKYQVVSEGGEVGTLVSERRKVAVDTGFEIQVRSELDISVEAFFFSVTLNIKEEMKIGSDGLSRYLGVFNEDGHQSNVSMNRVGERLHIVSDNHDVTLNCSDFDVTSAIAGWLVVQNKKQQQTFNVLDFDDFTVKEIDYSYLGKERVNWSGQAFECHLVNFKSEVKKGRQCLLEDQTGVWIFNEEGDDEGGHYQIQLVALEQVRDD